MIDDDIYNRIIEFKAKNEKIKMNRNYSNVDKRISTEKYVYEHHAYNKNNAGSVNVGFFPQYIWCHCKLRKCMDE